MINHTQKVSQTLCVSFDSLPVVDPKQPIHFFSSIQIPIKCSNNVNGWDKNKFDGIVVLVNKNFGEFN